MKQLSLLELSAPVAEPPAPPVVAVVVPAVVAEPVEAVAPVVVEEPAETTDRPVVFHELPQAVLDAGWSIVPTGCGWVRAVNVDGRATQDHFPAKHRGLKFVIREIERIEAAKGAQ